MFLTKRNGIWYLWYTDVNGKRRKKSTGTGRKSEAIKYLAAFKPNPKSPAVSKITLSSFRDEYTKYSKGAHTNKTTNHYRTAFNEFIRITGDISIMSITVRHVESFIAIKKHEASAWTAAKYHSALSTAFKTAIRWELIPENVFTRVKKPRIAEVRPAFFSREQFNELISVIDVREIRDIAIFGVCTGMRLGEIIALRWQDVDSVRRVINVLNYGNFTTKTKKSRTIPMSKYLCRLVDLRRGIVPPMVIGLTRTDRVFHDRGKPWREEKLSGKFKKYVRKAGLPEDLKFHSLRHTFASWLVQSGVSLYEVSRLLGHSTVKMSEKYAHLQTDKMHDTVDKITINF